MGGRIRAVQENEIGREFIEICMCRYTHRRAGDLSTLRATAGSKIEEQKDILLAVKLRLLSAESSDCSLLLSHVGLEYKGGPQYQCCMRNLFWYVHVT